LDQASIFTVSEVFNVECNALVDMTSIRRLNKGQGHSLVPIDFSYTTSYRLSIVNFALGRTVYPQYQTTDKTDATL